MDTKLCQDISHRIKLKRNEKQLTQTELGELINKSSQVISNWERGYSPTISSDDLVSLAKALDVSIDWLLGISEIQRNPTPQKVDLLQQMMSGEIKNTRPPILGGPVEPELPDSATIDMAKRIENLSDDNKQMIDKMLRALELEEKLKDEGVSGK